MIDWTDAPAAVMPRVSRATMDPAQGLLFDSRPAWYVSPRTRIERAFRAYHEKHPHVYDRLETMTLLALARGERVSMGALAEDLRRTGTLGHDAGGYGLNNDFRALYARLLIHHYPHLKTILAVRGRRERRQS